MTEQLTLSLSRDSSVGKESICNAGDPGLFPGSGKFSGEGIGCLFKYSWASLVAQTIKNQPTVWETKIQSLGWENPLEEGMATHFRILAWRIPMDRGAYRPQGCKELDTTEATRSDRVPDELWTEVCDNVQETGIKTIPMEKKCKEAKWLSGEALQIAGKEER